MTFPNGSSTGSVRAPSSLWDSGGSGHKPDTVVARRPVCEGAGIRVIGGGAHGIRRHKQVRKAGRLTRRPAGRCMERIGPSNTGEPRDEQIAAFGRDRENAQRRKAVRRVRASLKFLQVVEPVTV